jgi:hypothetical protein
LTEEVRGQSPTDVMAILKDKASLFEISTESGGSAQTIRCRLAEADQDSLGYVYAQIFPGKMLKEIFVTISLLPGPEGRGTVVTLGGRLLRMEAPPGTPIDAGTDVDHEVRTVWTYLKNIVMIEANARNVETISRTYNAGMRELFFMLRDPMLLVPAMYVTVEKNEARGIVRFQDPSGSLVYSIALVDHQEPDRLTYNIESNTSNMWVRSGRVELCIEKVHEARSVLTARAVSDRAQLSEQMRMSAMYLPAEQLSGYLSFRQDLGLLMSWIDAAVPLQLPHIRDMIVVQGDFVAGGKIEIKDSIVNRTTIETGRTGDDGKYIVHADRTTGRKVDIKDSVVNRSELGGMGKNVEVYQKSLQAAFLDGFIDDSEAAMIEMLQRSLGITQEDNLKALEEINILETDQVKQYEQTLKTILAGGMTWPSDEAALDTLRKQNGIAEIIHQALMIRLRPR